MRLLLLLLVLSAPSLARADWWVQTPDDLCVSRDVLVERIVGAVEPGALLGEGRQTARVAIDEQTGTVSILVARTGHPTGERVIRAEGAECSALADAAVFLLATLIEGGQELERTASVLPAGEGATRLAPPGSSTNAAPPRLESNVADGHEPSESPAPLQAGDLDAAAAQATSEQAGETQPSETTPGETTPGETTPGETTSSETTPSETTPSETTPSGSQPSESQPVNEPSSTNGFDVGAGAALRTGRNPGIGVGPTLSLGWTRGAFALRLSGTFLRGTTDFEERRLTVNAGELGLAACGGKVFRSLRLEGCGTLQVGLHSGRGTGFDVDQTSLRTSVGLGAELALSYRTGVFFVRLALGGVGMARQVRFVYSDRGGQSVAHAQSAGSFVGALTVGAHLSRGAS